MQCNRCQQRTAKVKVTQLLGGEKKDIYICEECAANLGTEYQLSFQDFFKGIIDMAMGLEGSFSDTSKANKTAANNKAVCSNCGISFWEFRQNGKLGCSKCYETFKDQLTPILKSIHGNTAHTGKLPQKIGAELLAKREKENLRKKMAEAIKEEEFELAAQLRDEIRRIEREENK